MLRMAKAQLRSPASTSAPPELFAVDPNRLSECLTKLSRAIAYGECTPEREELQALALICEHSGLPQWAARVRGWMASPRVRP